MKPTNHNTQSSYDSTQTFGTSKPSRIGLTLTLTATLLCGLAISASAQDSGVARPHGFERLRRPVLTAQRPVTRPPISTKYIFTVFDVPGTFTTSAFGINSGAASSKTEIVGAIGQDAINAIGFFGGFLMHYTKSKGTTTEAFGSVKMAGATQMTAFSVNDSGEIVGDYTDSSSVYHGYLYSGGVFTIIDVPFSGVTGTSTYGINNAGQIAGVFSDAAGYHGFLLSAGTYTSIDYPGATATYADNINNNGDVVGQYVDGSGFHGFLLSGGTYTSLDPPGSTYTNPEGINDAGDIVGLYCTTAECLANFDTFQGFLLSGGTYTTINIPGAVATALLEINNKGVIVGTHFDSVGNHGFLATP